MISKEKKTAIINEYARTPGDTGSPEVQVAVLTARIQELTEEYQVEEIVLGFPKNMNNTEGERCRSTLEFQELLKKRCNLPVVLWDERLTTVEAERSLMEGGVRREHRKSHVDRIAAVLILQGYLDARAFRAEKSGNSE